MITSEAELCAAVIKHLEENHYDVYQEVQMRYAEGRADTVGVRGPVSLIVEAKMSAGFAVFEQALKWKGYANTIAIALPWKPRATRQAGRRAMEAFARQNGIGLMRVQSEAFGSDVEWTIHPALDRHLFENIRGYLSEGHKTHAQAGTNRGGQWTPYRSTIEACQRALAEHGPMTLKALIENVGEHHYSTDTSARACLAKALASWEKDTFTVAREGRNFMVSLRANAEGGK